MSGEEKNREPDVTLDGAVTLFAELGVIPFIVLVGWQIKKYLKAGYWHGVSVADALAWAGSSWAANPRDWFGVYEILAFLPASPFVLVICPIAGGILGAGAYYLAAGVTKIFPFKP